MKYVSGRLRKLELGLSSHSETKQTLNVIGNVDITGIASASAFADFDYLQAPYGSTVSFTVTVASKSNHRYSGGSSNAYYINGIESPVLTLTPGRTYRFNNNNTGSHPFRFYYDADRTIQYTAGVNFQNTYTEITISDTTPNILHYQCVNHALMGNSVVTNSNVVDSPYAATLRDSLTVSGNITANGNILGDNSTNISGINSVTATSFFGDGSGLVNVVIPGISTSGTTELTNLEILGNLKVAGVSTFGNDKVIVGGATTDLLVNGSARVTGELKVGDGTITLNSAGLSTFPTGVDVSGGSGLIASSAKISDLTSGRIVFAGAGGELEDSANLTFDGTTLSGSFSGDGSGLSGVSIPGINTSGTTEFTNLDLSGTLKVAGVSTFSGNINANGNIVGDNSTNITGIAGVTATTLAGTLQTAAQPNVTSLGTLTSLNVTGVSTLATVDINGGAIDGTIIGANSPSAGTFTNITATDIDLNGDIDVDGHTELDDVNVSGASTFATAKVTDLTDNRIVIAGTGGELEDTGKLTFDGTTLAIIGDATFTGNVSVAGTLTSEDKTNIDSLGIVTARTGVRISSGGLVVSSGVATFTDAIDSNGGANISGGSGLVVSSGANITGGLVADTAKVSDLTNGRVVYAGASGELQDSSNLTFNGTTLTGTFGGDGTALLVTIPGISTTTTSEFTNLSVVGVLTAGSAILGSAKVSDLTSGRVVYAGNSGELQDNSTFTFNGSVVNAPAFAGDGSALTGITAGGVGAIGGLTVKDEGVVVGTAGSIATLDFIGGGVSVVATSGAAGIASVTVSTVQNPDVQTINVSGVSTFAGNINANGNIVGDNSTNISGINSVTATSFFGDGSGLENTGATLSAASGSQRLVLTSLTSGTMTSAATDADLSFDATTNLLSAGKLLIAGISTFSDDVELTGGQKHLTLNGQDKKLIFKNGGTDKLEIFHNDGGGGSNQIYSNAGSQPLKIHSAGMGGIELFVQVGAGLNKGIQLGAQGDVIPSSNNSIDLGTNNNRFGHIYGGDGIFSRDIVVGAGLSVAGVATVTGNLDLNNGLDVTSGHVVLSEGVEFKMGTSSNLEIISISGNKARIQSQQEHLEICTGTTKEIKFRSDRTGTNAGWNINVDGDLIPSADSTVDIGSNTVRVQNFYADTLYGDGSNLTGITAGATLSAASGSQRLVLTSLTSGTMTTAATDADLSFDATDNLLNAGKLLIAGISTFGDDVELTGHQKHLTLNGQDKKLIFKTSNTDKFEIFHDDANGGANKIYSNAGSQPLKIHTGGLGGIQLFVNGGSKGIQLGAQGDVIPYNGVDLGHTNNRFEHIYGQHGAFSADVLVGAGLSVAGVSTFTGAIDANGDLDVDGHTELDNVNIAGVTTLTEAIYPNQGSYGTATAGKIKQYDNRLYVQGGTDGIIFADHANNKWQINSSGYFMPFTDSTFDIGDNTTRVRNIYADTLYGDGSNLTNLPSSGGGGDKFNTTITNSVQANVYGYETNIISLPSDSTKRYVIESISLGNVTSAVGSTVNVIASINPGVTTYSSEYKVYLAYNAPVPDNGLIELIKQPMVMNPSDVLKVWATDSSNTGINGALELYATYTEHESTDYIAGYGSTTNITTTALATIYTSTSYPTIIQSIKATNRTDTGDFPVTIQIVNGSTITHLAKDFIVPRYASVEFLDRPKRIEAGATIRMQQSSAANTVDVIVSGKKITS